MEQPFNFKEGAMLEKNLDAKFYRKNKTPGGRDQPFNI
jgi:hypothetical protein